MTWVSKARRISLALLTVLTVLGIGLFRWTAFQKSILPVYGSVSDFNLVDQQSRAVTLEALKGKVWIANFIFTRCAGICPMMSARMRTVQEKLNGAPDFLSVSFSVDPERDTPTVLAEYAAHFNANPERWRFLTGNKDELFRLSQQHFHLGVSEIPESEQEAPGQRVNHSSKFVLVDREGKIRGYYESSEEADLERLVRDARNLGSEKRK